MLSPLCAKSLQSYGLFVTPWAVAHRALLSMGFSTTTATWEAWCLPWVTVKDLLMTSLFLFLIIIEMIPSSHVHQRDHIQKNMKIPYPSCNVLPSLTPWCVSIPSMLHHAGLCSFLGHGNHMPLPPDIPKVTPLIYSSFIPLSSKTPSLGAAQLPHLEYQPLSFSIPETHFFSPKQLLQVDLNFVLFNLFVAVLFSL